MENKNALVLAAVVGMSMASYGQSSESNDKTQDRTMKRDICVLRSATLPIHAKVCTEEFVSADVIDGDYCYYKSCEVEEDGSCPTYFVKRKTSRVPENDYCSYHRPIEL